MQSPFPGKPNFIAEAERELFEETGLVIPESAEKRLIEKNAQLFVAGVCSIFEKEINRQIQSVPVIFRFKSTDLPIIILNKEGVVEADVYFWLNMSPLYSSSEYRPANQHIGKAIQSSEISFQTDPLNTKILNWPIEEGSQLNTDLLLSEVTRNATAEYVFWIMENVSVQGGI